MMKRFAAALTALILALAMLSVNVSAAGACNLKQTSTAKVGEKFTVNVDITPDDEFAILSISIRYDNTKLKVESVKDGGILEGFYDVKMNGSVQLTWTGNGKALKTAGTYATITFSVIEEDPVGSMLQSTVTAHTANHIRVPVDGSTAIILFNTDVDNTPPEIVDPDPGEFVSEPSTPAVTDDTENLDDEEDIVEVTEPTTAATTTQATTTTRAKTKKTTPESTKAPEPVTNPEPVTEPPATETQPTTEPVQEPETPPTSDITDVFPLDGVVSMPGDDVMTLPGDDFDPFSENYPPEQSESDFSDAYADSPVNKGADRGTILIALMALALTVVVVVAIEMTKRGK